MGHSNYGVFRKSFTLGIFGLSLIVPVLANAELVRSNGSAYEPVSTTAITITTTPTLTVATNSSDTKLYRFVSTVDANIAFGPSPTATISSTFLPAYSVEVWPIHDNYKASVRANSGSGTFYIDQLAK
jgi:hypothetical protein